ncbi:MAG: DUF3368 domain-containing protein [Nanohaloarchaea archaeon SW_7_43_1]|nr:MAG: DUF3368 domain-containing protein [Nanohaloarchaea archaeon SW_7_43_1]
MARNNIVVSDTSPLLNLAFIDRLELLEAQFGKIRVPEQVWEEIQEGEKGKDLLDNRKGILIEIVKVEEESLYTELRQKLDKGESAAITHAIKSNADLVLLDEKEGRQTARKHNLEATGVIGVLIKASKNEKIDLKQDLDNLKDEGFWISEELYRNII